MSARGFRNRVHAGQLLAAALADYADRDDVIVLALPRGGVPVAFEVAEKLHVPLDVIVVRKLGLPGWEELAMGAIASGGVLVRNEDVLRQAGVPEAALRQVAEIQLEELRRRELAYRGHEGAPEIAGRTVILVDDGIATGSTLRAAVQALRQLGAKGIVVAAPVGANDSCAMLEPMVDGVVVLLRPERFQAVGLWYEDFSQTTDEEVTELLARSAPSRHPISKSAP
jgi:putative phosphoribosyl transferase